MRLILFILIFSLNLFISAQGKWYYGNLKDVNELSIHIEIDSLEDQLWVNRIMNYIEMSLAQTKIKIDKTLPIPRLAVEIFIIDSNIDKVSSFMINYGLYNYALPDREYIESVQDTLITKKFRIHKVYEKEILGQSNSASVHLEIEEAIIKHTSDFIEQWFRDNPFRQF